MKRVSIDQVTLDSCVDEAQQQRLLITRDGNPVAIVVGVAGLDEEQIELGASDEFWTLIDQRRKEKTISRAELEKAIEEREQQEDASQ